MLEIEQLCEVNSCSGITLLFPWGVTSLCGMVRKINLAKTAVVCGEVIMLMHPNGGAEDMWLL